MKTLSWAADELTRQPAVDSVTKNRNVVQQNWIENHNWEWYEVYEVTMELKTELRALKVKCDVV